MPPWADQGQGKIPLRTRREAVRPRGLRCDDVGRAPADDGAGAGGNVGWSDTAGANTCGADVGADPSGPDRGPVIPNEGSSSASTDAARHCATSACAAAAHFVPAAAAVNLPAFASAAAVPPAHAASVPASANGRPPPPPASSASSGPRRRCASRTPLANAIRE